MAAQGTCWFFRERPGPRDGFPPLDRLVPEYVKRFEAYIPSKPDDELKKLYGCTRLFRLNNNENPLGPPPGGPGGDPAASRRPGPPSTPAGMPTTCGTGWRKSSAFTRTSSWWATGPTR